MNRNIIYVDLYSQTCPNWLITIVIADIFDACLCLGKWRKLMAMLFLFYQLIIGLKQGLENYGPQAKSSPLPAFIWHMS